MLNPLLQLLHGGLAGPAEAPGSPPGILQGHSSCAGCAALTPSVAPPPLPLSAPFALE